MDSPTGTYTMKLLGDRILVKRWPEKEKFVEGGIVVRPDAHKEKQLVGDVVGVGPGKWNVSRGTFDPMYVKVGDTVLYGQFSGSQIDEDFGKDLVIMRMDEVMSVIEEFRADESEAEAVGVAES